MPYEYAQGLSSAIISREEAKRLRKLEKEAKELDKTPAPEYELSPAITKAYEEAQGIYAKGQQRAKYGYSPEEQASFANALARNQNVQMQRGQQAAGGQASRYIGSALAANNLQAASDFLARDAAFKQQKQNYADSLFGNVAGMARTLQSQQNQIQQNRIRRRELLENALGRGMSQARMNMYGAMYKTAGSMDASQNQLQQDVKDLGMALIGMPPTGGGNTKSNVGSAGSNED